jgi:Uma2 family endonuclease
MKETTMATPTTVGTQKKLITADEFWDFVHLPENENRDFELIRGEVVEMSRPTHPHGRVCFRVGMMIELYAERVGKGYVVTNDSGVVLAENPDTVVGPDVAYFTNVNAFDDMNPKWADVPPLLVAEVRSPHDRPNTLIAKIRDYLKNGVKIVWLIDYEERTVAVFRPNMTPDVVSERQELTGGDELPGFICQVADFFRLPGERPTSSTPLLPHPPTSS